MESTRAKVAASAAVLLIGLVATILASGTSTAVDYSSGIVIDFGDYDAVYSPQDEADTPEEALEAACDSLGYDLSYKDGSVYSIGGTAATSTASWALYVVYSGDTEWTLLEDAGDTVLSDYTAVCYGYCADGEDPAPAVDSTGYSIYGYDTPTRIVSLAPSCTETICSVGGAEYIVGTDLYSNYPASIVEGQEDGTIAIVGGFTNPSYEKILQQDPDLVVCISTQSGHLQTAEKLRAVGYRVVVLDGGESIDAVLDNIFRMGVVMDDAEDATETIEGLETSMGELASAVEAYMEANGIESQTKVMVALSALQSPWVSGANTYVHDVLGTVYAYNVYSSEDGWVQVNAETIIQYNPEVIIVVNDEYEATEEDYQLMLGDMSAEWQGTDAYKDGRIYLFTGDANDCASRAGPRVAELAELVARAVYGGAFADGVALPMYIGDDYKDYVLIAEVAV